MTTLEGRPNTALLVVDVQNGAVARRRARWRAICAPVVACAP
jgi:nicotinamidase-related amidase